MLPLSLKIAIRYIFSKKSHSAVNAISAVSICGVAIATMAMICSLSVYNGFQEIVAELFSDLDPQIEITPARGKVLRPDGGLVDSLMVIDGVEVITPVLEESALAIFGDTQLPIKVRGVPQNYTEVSNIEHSLRDGVMFKPDNAKSSALLGVGVATALKVGPSFHSPIKLYVPKRLGRVNIANPINSFNEQQVFCIGVFAVNQPQYDNKYIYIPINDARKLFSYETEATELEVKLTPTASVKKVKKDIKSLLGDSYNVKDREEQQSEAFSIMKIEKWITFQILALVLIIAAFNIVTSVLMLIIDKRENIKTLYNIGATNGLITEIFFLEGVVITTIGSIFGVVIGVALSLIQQHYGLLKMGANFVVENYPVVVNPVDIIIVIVTVTVVGIVASWYPVKYLSQKIKL